jgi:hypothetical protein
MTERGTRPDQGRSRRGKAPDHFDFAGFFPVDRSIHSSAFAGAGLLPPAASTISMTSHTFDF